MLAEYVYLSKAEPALLLSLLCTYLTAKNPLWQAPCQPMLPLHLYFPHDKQQALAQRIKAPSRVESGMNFLVHQTDCCPSWNMPHVKVNCTPLAAAPLLCWKHWVVKLEAPHTWCMLLASWCLHCCWRQGCSQGQPFPGPVGCLHPFLSLILLLVPDLVRGEE